MKKHNSNKNLFVFPENQTKDDDQFYRCWEETPKIANALKAYDFCGFVSITPISGPGNHICIYHTQGDIRVACVNHKFEVLWNHACGSCELDPGMQRGSATDKITTQELYEYDGE